MSITMQTQWHKVLRNGNPQFPINFLIPIPICGDPTLKTPHGLPWCASSRNYCTKELPLFAAFLFPATSTVQTPQDSPHHTSLEYALEQPSEAEFLAGLNY